MLKISDALRGIIHSNSLLQFGLSYELINITHLARFIEPHIETRIKKPVSHSSIVMALSRFQRSMKKTSPQRSNYHIQNLTIYSNLASITYLKSEGIHETINTLYSHIQKKRGYITITEGINEITVICDDKFVNLIKKTVSQSPKDEKYNVASVGVKFDEAFIDSPGLLYMVLQQIALQNINLVEISSTYTEFILYINEKDMKLAFNTLFHCFTVDQSMQLL